MLSTEAWHLVLRSFEGDAVCDRRYLGTPIERIMSRSPINGQMEPRSRQSYRH